jgi:FAD/FMN-containing dehydrogenase
VAAVPMPYPGIYELTAEGGTPHASTTRSVFLDVLDDASVDALLAGIDEMPPGSMIQIRVFGGAMSRVPVEATAFAHRDAAVQVTVMSAFIDEASVPASVEWNRALFGALEPRSTGVYANFLEDEGDARVRAAYPSGTYERLAEIKRRYDPANIFHRNQNIRPERESTTGAR